MVEIVGVKVWEFGFWEVKFCVGILPKEEVAEAKFPASADHEVDVREVLVEIFGEVLLGKVGDFVLGFFSRDAFDGVDNFGTAAIVEAEINDAASIVFGLVGNPITRFDDLFWKWCVAATEDDFDVVFHEGFELAATKNNEDIHEMANFLGAALEVFGREDIEAGNFDATIKDVIGEGFEIFEAGVVALHASEAALFCPATVAVNNNGDMGRKFDSLTVDFDKLFVC